MIPTFSSIETHTRFYICHHSVPTRSNVCAQTICKVLCAFLLNHRAMSNMGHQTSWCSSVDRYSGSGCLLSRPQALLFLIWLRSNTAWGLLRRQRSGKYSEIPVSSLGRNCFIFFNYFLQKYNDVGFYNFYQNIFWRVWSLLF